MAAHCSRCVFTAVSVHLDGLNAEDKFRVWVTILGHTPLPLPLPLPPLKKPSTFPSSTCIDLLRGDSCMLWGLFHICYMCSSSISYMLTAGCCGCIGSRKSRYLVCHSNNISRSIPPRPNTLPLSCTLPCQSLRELSWQNYTLLYFWSNVLVIIKDFFQKHFL